MLEPLCGFIRNICVHLSILQYHITLFASQAKQFLIDSESELEIYIYYGSYFVLRMICEFFSYCPLSIYAWSMLSIQHLSISSIIMLLFYYDLIFACDFYIFPDLILFRLMCSVWQLLSVLLSLHVQHVQEIFCFDGFQVGQQYKQKQSGTRYIL